MAYDTKRLKMFKWLQSLADHDAAYCKNCFKNITDICVFCGSLYATNEIVLAKVDYPEFEHLSDWEWGYVSKYVDDDGYLLEVPEVIKHSRVFKNDRIFDDMFLNKSTSSYVNFNPKVIHDALKPFEIYCLKPSVTTGREKMQFSAHDKEVSIRVLMMGMR